MTRFDRRTFLAGAAGSLLLPAAASTGARRTGLEAIVDEVTAAAQSELGVAGLVVGAVAPAGSHVAGAGDAGGGRAPSGTTLFQIASVTKTFTALALARAVAAGRVDLDDPVARHLPEGFDVPSSNGVRVTLEHLATGTSGLPRLPPGIETLPGFDPRDPYAHVTLADVAAALRATTLRSTPGRRFEYSNFGAGLLGIALAHGRDVSYEALVRESIARPLRLADTVVTRSPDQVRRSASGHDAQGQPAPDWHLPAIPGAGALWGTADDLLRYLRAHLTLRPARLATAVRDVRRPRARVDRRTRIGLAWLRSRERGVGPIAWHNGMVGGYASFVAFAPGARLGVAVLANTAKPVDAVGVAVLRALARGR